MTSTDEAAKPGRPPVDWSAGHYETTAEQLRPAAEAVVAAAAPALGELVVDVGTGTGNAALLAAARGARAIGVDPAQRLLAVARERAAADGVDAEFRAGVAESLPLDDGIADAVLSVFGVVFADATAAIAEMVRVLRPDGRIVFSAWLPIGAMARMTGTLYEAVRAALGAPPPQQFPWYDRSTLATVFGTHGLDVTIEEHALAFTGPSPRAFAEAESRNHPMAVFSRDLLERHGGPNMVDVVTRILEEGNEDPAAFRVTSQYVVATARRR
jgi:SAM-dependent methyltransferase